MPPTLTRIDQVAGGITFHCSLARGEAQSDGDFSGGDVVNFCLSAVEGNKSLYRMQCQRRDGNGDYRCLEAQV